MARADGITLQLQGERLVLQRIEQLRARASDLRPVMEDIGAVMERNVQARFDLKEDPGGRRWAPLAAATRASYDRADRSTGRGGKPEVRHRGTLLERTGLMRQSLSTRASSDEVEIGFGREPAVYHEFGTKRMPRRGLLTADPNAGTLGDDDRSDVLSVVESYFRTA